MATLIKDRQVVAGNSPSPDGQVVRLEPTDDPAAFADRLPGASRVEVHFPKFGDGRGFSLGRLLRDRYGYKGELRASGDVLVDQIPTLTDIYQYAVGSPAGYRTLPDPGPLLRAGRTRCTGQRSSESADN